MLKNLNSDRKLNCTDFLRIIKERILIFDGAMGTQLQARNLNAKDFGGEQLEGCNENLVLTRPDVIEDIHVNYLAAGADFIETNTFGATGLVLDEYGLRNKAFEINKRAAEIAKKACLGFANDSPRFVAGSMGPTTKAICVTGGVTFDQLVMHYAEQAQGLLEGGADLLLLETGQDTLNIKAGLIGIWQALKTLSLKRKDVPVMVSGTIEPMGTMLSGQCAESLYTSLEHADLSVIGLNCATGPDAMRDHINSLSLLATYPTACMPNAGLPDEEGNYHETPTMFADKLALFLEKGLVNIVGGCCGTTPKHICALKQMASNFKPREFSSLNTPAVCGIDYLDLKDTSPVIVGERTNVIGSKLFKELITSNQFEEAAEIGRKQVRKGAHIVDICLANPDRNELEDMSSFLEFARRTIRSPLMIDTTDAEVLETALKMVQGKCIVNSINLEDGEERFEQICPLVKKYGSSVVVGCIDEDPEQGMATTVERKLEIAHRSFDLLTKKYHIPASDIIFDPLVFPCGTGDKQYIGSAKETIVGVLEISKAFPKSFTILGISNVSFGLPTAGREALNTVFLHKNFEAGLNMAIVNSEKLQRITQIDGKEISLCESLINATSESFENALAEFVQHFRDKKGQNKPTVNRKNITLEERLSTSVVEGVKSFLEEDLKEARIQYKPLEIINGPLMDGMKTVGDLFGENKLIVAEVLQSAEVMKTAVSFLEPFMEKSDHAHKGKMLLATVKGDVHDIGKNLVDIIFANNGYNIVNLGIKIPPQTLIDAHKEHHPDLIGLSGLLVKSAQEMVTTAEALRDAGIHTPLFVGGAALSEKFTYKKIAAKYQGPVCYAKDAMSGLKLANQATDKHERDSFFKTLQKKKTSLVTESNKQANKVEGQDSLMRKVEITYLKNNPTPPDTDLHILSQLSLETLWEYVNPSMLYTRHLGLKGKIEDLLKINDSKAISLNNSVLKAKDLILEKKLFTCKAVYQFVKAESVGEKIYLMVNKNTPSEDILFPRQTTKEGKCIADLVAPAKLINKDYVGLFVTSCQGNKVSIRELAESFKQRGEYLNSHIILALAIETAEAAAEWLHQKMRAMWGIADAKELSTRELFQAKYRGRRYSFGYPACPELEDQKILWRILKPKENIQVELTEGCMMDPESSVSALVFHHPQATYFSTI